MKNNNIVIILLVMLFLIELSNQYWMLGINKQLKNMEKNMSEYFEPILPEWEDSPEIK